MSSIVYQTNKANGNVYAYESESYRDPISKKPRCRRKYLGRVDPETKLIIPKAEDGKRNRRKNPIPKGVLPDEVLIELEDQRKLIKQLQSEVQELSQKNKDSNTLIQKMKKLLDTYE